MATAPLTVVGSGRSQRRAASWFYDEPMSAGGSDGELLLRARDGDSDAWYALVERLQSRVWAVARAHRLSHADAQDVCQVTWYRLVTHIKTIREPDRVGAWLAATARHESLRLLKRSGRQVPTGDAFEFEGPDRLAPSPDARLLASERQRAVWDAVATLPDHCQRLLRLLMADPPFTYDEITELLGRPQGSIGPTRRRCLEKLREQLSGELDGPATPQTKPQPKEVKQ
jgi:RNA polymerase sigma factor (sigma-70 family)